MRLFLQTFFFCLSCTAFSFSAVAQQATSPLLTGSFNNASFAQFVQEVETKTAYHFYYDPVQLDSLSITGSFEQAPLNLVLEQLFKDSGFEYGLDTKSKNVYISKGQKIYADLPAGFLQKRSPG